MSEKCHNPPARDSKIEVGKLAEREVDPARQVRHRP
jgi:hypothetical protein